MILSHQLVGAGIFVAESVTRAVTAPHVLGNTYKQSLTILCAFGTALGVAVALLAATRRALRVPASTFYGVLMAPVAYAVGTNLFGGAWISRQWFAPYGPFALAAAGLCTGFWGARLAETARARPSWLWSAGLAALGVVLAVADARLLPGLYPVLHIAALVSAWLALAQALVGMPWRPRLWTASQPWALLVILAVAVSAPASWLRPPALNHRLQWDRSPGYASRLYEQGRMAWWRFSARAFVTRFAPEIKAWLENDPRLKSIRHAEAHAAWSAATSRPEAGIEALDPGSARPHIVVITVDALRADVAALGTEWSALAARGVSFERAYAPGSSTGRSVPTLVSGRYDWRQQQSTVVRALAAAGYSTSLVSERAAIEYLRHHEQEWFADLHTLAGVDAPQGSFTSARVIERASAVLRARPVGSPVFAWVHFFDQHEWLRRGARAGTLRERYERVWREQDAAVGRYVRTAESILRDRPVAFVLTSDHGEYAGDAGRDTHTRWVDLQLTHIPLVVLAPGHGPERITRPVGLFDVAATIAHVAGLRDFECDAVSLLRRDVDPRRPLLMGDTSEIAIVRGPYRLTITPLLGGMRLFDDSDITKPRAVSPETVEAFEQDLLLPLLGSPMASASGSPLNEL